MTCQRYAYEYTGLIEAECPDATNLLKFDAKAFCCNEIPPENCSICSEGKILESEDKEVTTEFFGAATCGEINSYASYLPDGECAVFLSELLDDPFGAEGQCCMDDPNAGASDGGGSSDGAGKTLGTVSISLMAIAIL